MQRHTLGILAIVFTVVGLASFTHPEYPYFAISWRIGIVLIALWLALPQLQGFSVWLRRAAIVVAVVAAAFHKYGLILLPLIFFMWLFSKKKAAETDSAEENSNSA